MSGEGLRRFKTYKQNVQQRYQERDELRAETMRPRVPRPRFTVDDDDEIDPRAARFVQKWS